MIFIFFQSLVVSESTLQVPPSQKWILDLPRVGRGQERSTQTILGGYRNQSTNNINENEGKILQTK
jgi:hypothetical protein